MKKTLGIAALFVLSAIGFSSSALAEWANNGGGVWQNGGNGVYTKLTTVESTSNGVLVTSTLEPTPANGGCAPNGGIYFDASQPGSKYLYATVLTAISMNRDVIVLIDCDANKGHARLIQIDMVSASK